MSDFPRDHRALVILAHLPPDSGSQDSRLTMLTVQRLTVAVLISVRKVWLRVAECRRVFIHCVIASGFAVVVVRRSGCAARSAPSVDAWSARSCDEDRAGVFYS